MNDVEELAQRLAAVDYLVDEVLARQTEEIRDFLLHTAVLERLNGSLCDQVTERADGHDRPETDVEG